MLTHLQKQSIFDKNILNYYSKINITQMLLLSKQHFKFNDDTLVCYIFYVTVFNASVCI